VQDAKHIEQRISTDLGTQMVESDEQPSKDSDSTPKR
jgi:hypothetical protein